MDPELRPPFEIPMHLRLTSEARGLIGSPDARGTGASEAFQPMRAKG